MADNDDPARQERMAELEREIADQELAFRHSAFPKVARELRDKKIAELSRLRNEGGLDHPDSIRHELGDLPPSSSDLPAREAIEIATWMLEHSYATGHGDTIADMLGELEAQAKERALQPLSQGNGEAVAWQPIETAPKTGKMIIVLGGVAHWYNDQWYSLTGFNWPGRPIDWPVKEWLPIPSLSDLLARDRTPT